MGTATGLHSNTRPMPFTPARAAARLTAKVHLSVSTLNQPSRQRADGLGWDRLAFVRDNERELTHVDRCFDFNGSVGRAVRQRVCQKVGQKLLHTSHVAAKRTVDGDRAKTTRPGRDSPASSTTDRRASPKSGTGAG